MANVAVSEPTELGETVIARGRVMLVGGQPLPDVRVSYRLASGQPVEKHLRSGDGGWFELEVAGAVGVFEAADDRYSTVMVAMARPEAAGTSVLLVAPRLDFAGRIVDEAGAPVEGAAVSIRSTQPITGGAVVLDASQTARWNTRSNAVGRFALPGTPQLSGARLEVLALGFRPHREPAPEYTDRAIEVVLQRPDVDDTGIHGIVLSPEGWLVPHALVSHGTSTGATDAGGQFELLLREEDRQAPLIAVKRGFQPAILPPEAFTEEMTLQLGPPPLTISGQVLDSDGRPMNDVKVWIAEPTYFGVIDKGPVWLEGLTTAQNPEFWAPASTDHEGRFEIPGLLVRPYRLRALQTESLLETTVDDVLGGTEELTITMPTDRLLDKLTGRVVSMAGKPLSRIQIMHYRQTLRKEPPNGWTQSAAEPGAMVMSDEEGRFEFHKVPGIGMTILAQGDGVMPRQVELAEEDLLGELELVLEQQVHLQVQLTGSIDRADELRVLNDANEPMEQFLMRAQRGQVNSSWPITQGRSPVVTVGETASFVELLKDSRRVVLIPLILVEGEVNVVRY